jgi:hypothetical protein
MFFTPTLWMPTSGESGWSPSLANATLSEDYVAGSYVNNGVQASSSGTWTNSAGKYIINSSGVLQRVTSGIPLNHSWNGSSATALGLLLEGANTNYMANSNNFGTGGWVSNAPNWGSAPTVAQTATGPDGVTNSAWSWTSTNTNGIPGDTFDHSGVGGWMSIYAKAGNVNYLVLSQGALSNAYYFDLVTGVATAGTGNANGSTMKMEQLANGWWRCSGYCNGGIFGIGAVSAVNGTGTSGNQIFVYGAQFDYQGTVNPGPSSYHPTSGSTATRPADSFTFPTALTETILKNGPGTAFINVELYSLDQSAGGGAGLISNASASWSGRESILDISPTPTLESDSVTPFAYNISAPASVPAIGATIKAAVAFSHEIGGQTALNGTAGTLTAGWVSFSPATFGFAPHFDLGPGNNYATIGGYLNGHVRQFALWPIAASQAQLVSLTT